MQRKRLPAGDAHVVQPNPAAELRRVSQSQGLVCQCLRSRCEAASLQRQCSLPLAEPRPARQIKANVPVLAQQFAHGDSAFCRLRDTVALCPLALELRNVLESEGLAHKVCTAQGAVLMPVVSGSGYCNMTPRSAFYRFAFPPLSTRAPDVKGCNLKEKSYPVCLLKQSWHIFFHSACLEIDRLHSLKFCNLPKGDTAR